MDQKDIQPSQTMKLASLTDLLRLVVSIMGRSNVSRYLYYGKTDQNEHIYFLTHTVGGWYNLRGLPVTLAAFSSVEPQTNFVEYTSPTTGDEESYKFVEEIKQSSNSVVIPIIKLKELPDFMI